MFIADAAELVAVSKCFLARMPDAPIRLVTHATCGWCIYPPEVLIEAIKDFWAKPGNHAIALAFEALPREMQHELVEKAAGRET